MLKYLCATAALLIGTVVFAQDGDSFFDDTPLVNEKPEVSAEFKDTLLNTSPITWGGNFNFNIGVYATWDKSVTDFEGDDLFRATGEDSKVDLSSSLFFSARPTSDQRYYGKLLIDYPFALDAASFEDSSKILKVPNIKIWELYADFPLFKGVQIRAGKQMAKWGVGYFFKPADILSLQPVDPQEPEAEIEGPIMVKSNIAFDVNNLDLYIVAGDQLDSAKDIAYAGRFTFVTGGFEFGLGARYQYIDEGVRGSNLQFIGTATGSIWKFSVFGEALVEHGSKKGFLKEKASVPIVGYEVVDRNEDWFFKGSLGFIYNDTENYFSIMGQYLFNGEGYTGDLSKLKTPIYYYLGQGTLVASDGADLAQHYIAMRGTVDFASDSDVHVSMFWIGSLQDWSGLVKPGVSFDIGDYVTLGFDAQFKYGDDKTEYGGNTFLKPFKIGFNVNLAPGSF